MDLNKDRTNDVAIRTLNSLDDFWNILHPPSLHPGPPIEPPSIVDAREDGYLPHEWLREIIEDVDPRVYNDWLERDVQEAVVAAGPLLKPYDYHFDVMEIITFYAVTLARLYQAPQTIPKGETDTVSDDNVTTRQPNFEMFWKGMREILEPYLNEERVGPMNTYDERRAYYRSILETRASEICEQNKIPKSREKKHWSADFDFVAQYRHKKFIDHYVHQPDWRLQKEGKRFGLV
ncbi:hypothetical protein CC2G_013924 [Coprinopsis cinerea AmutBmut pab1-1]|nr:hypothetical protein CC2G_013924 [Coprinopsis cinerea AmutBmut pab1-1]